MKPLNELFQEQAKAIAPSREETSTEDHALVRFTIGGSSFAVDIANVVEVSEMLPIVRYPELSPGHLGVINLRGNILPVLSFRDSHKPSDDRLLVLEFIPGERFCTPVSSPKKVAISQSPMESHQDIIAIDGRPTSPISERDFPAILNRTANIEES